MVISTLEVGFKSYITQKAHVCLAQVLVELTAMSLYLNQSEQNVTNRLVPITIASLERSELGAMRNLQM